MKRENECSEIPEDFRGLIWQPSCEQEVVALFFLLLPHLKRAFAMEEVGTGFPDCKVYERSEAGEWEAKAMEFETRSRDFEAHGHDPAECDLIVCWQDNWPQCPIEVIELRTELHKLPEPRRFVLHPDRPLHPPQAWEVEDYKATCAEQQRDLELRLLESLDSLAAQYRRIANPRGGSGKQPCYHLQIVNPRTGVTCNPVGAEAPGIVYVDWRSPTSGVAKAWRELAEGYERLVRPVAKPDNKEYCGNIRLADMDDVAVVCRAVEWLLQEASRRAGSA